MKWIYRAVPTTPHHGVGTLARLRIDDPIRKRIYWRRSWREFRVGRVVELGTNHSVLILFVAVHQGLVYQVFAGSARVPSSRPFCLRNPTACNPLPHHPPEASPPEPARPVFIGIDWADQAHAICLIDPAKPTPQHSSLDQKPEAIATWAEALHKKYIGRELCLIIESSKGALITALIEVGGFTIYPINPKQAARYREALHPTGSQSDPVAGAPNKQRRPKPSTKPTKPPA